MYLNTGDNMKVYLDSLLILNLFIDYFILYGTKKLLKRKTSIKRLILGSIVGSLTTFTIFLKLTSLKLLIIKLVLSIFIILVTFGTKNFIENIFYFYIISIIIGGLLYLINIKLNYFSLLLVIPIIINIYINKTKEYKLNIKNNYIVEIIIKDKVYKLEGMIDTGNHLEDPYKKRGVILANINIDYKKYKYLYVPYHALNYNGLIPCIKPDKIIIDNKVITNYLIGISKDKFNLNGSECILPNKIQEDL